MKSEMLQNQKLFEFWHDAQKVLDFRALQIFDKGCSTNKVYGNFPRSKKTWNLKYFWSWGSGITDKTQHES
jgi:hypothetical protein